jgi:hypothetical protein
MISRTLVTATGAVAFPSEQKTLAKVTWPKPIVWSFLCGIALTGTNVGAGHNALLVGTFWAHIGIGQITRRMQLFPQLVINWNVGTPNLQTLADSWQVYTMAFDQPKQMNDGTQVNSATQLTQLIGQEISIEGRVQWTSSTPGDSASFDLYAGIAPLTEASLR